MQMRPSATHNRFFTATAVAAGAFIVTILALVAGVFGDPAAPLARVLDRFGGLLLAVEVVVLLVCGFLAMAIDRRENSASIRRDNSDTTPPRQDPHVAEHSARD